MNWKRQFTDREMIRNVKDFRLVTFASVKIMEYTTHVYL